MRVTIVGGGLQGVELCWLARKAGWETLLVDSRSAPPALRLADAFLRYDATALAADDGPTREVMDRMAETAVVIPALENGPALAALERACARRGVPFAFDARAYAVTASKLRSRELFLRCGTPIPRPAGDRPAFPLIAKPSGGSGSRGVRLLPDEAALNAYLPEGSAGWILESYCPGPSFSLEICGTPGRYRTFQTTELLMDAVFDCRAVLAPACAPSAVVARMETELVRLAEALELHGLMDLEVILGEDGIRVLEIDARFPSQTPTAVWLSSGVNLAEHLVSCFLPLTPQPGFRVPRHARYEHIAFHDGAFHFPGEHVMSGHGPLVPLRDWHGADEALVGGDPDGGDWVATLLFTGTTAEDAEARRGRCLRELGVSGTSASGGDA